MTDIILNGVAYSVAPGAYRKESRRPGVVVAGRVELGPFGHGALQAIGDDAARGWEALGVGPVFDGAGVEPWPHSQGWADAALADTPSATVRGHGMVAGSAAYVGLGRRIYKSVALTNGTWANLTVAADLGAGFAISGLAYYQDDLLVMLASGQDIRKYNTATNALSVWRTGEKGQVGAGYAGQLIYAPLAANNQEELRFSGTKWDGAAVTHRRWLDAPIVNMALFDGRVAIATRRSLWLMGGQPYPGEADDPAVTADTSKAPVWSGDPEPVLTHGAFAEGDDFTFLASYRGRLYTWLRGRVAEYDRGAGWRRLGPEGARCYGATVAGDWLVVVIEARDSASGDTVQYETWGFDGEGWWLLARSATNVGIWPCPLSGAGERDLAVFRGGATTYDLYRVRRRSDSVNSYSAGGSWTSSLLDGNEPGIDKGWTALGADFAAPTGRGAATSSDAVTLTLDASTDGGVTWSTAATLTTSAGQARTFILGSDFSVILRSRTLQLRVSWSSVSDWAPVLARVWADYESGIATARKRRWELTIGAGDRNVQRDGQRDPREGRSLVQSLWGAWEAGASLTLEDIDADTGWTPAALGSKLKGWFKADRIEGASNGAPLALWEDLSGAGHHAAQGTAANQPHYRAAQLNGLPALDFDGGADWLGCSIAATSRDETIVAVVDLDSATDYRTILGPNAGGSRQFAIEQATRKLLLIKPGSAILATSAAILALDTPSIVCAGLSPTTIELGLNGTIESFAEATAFAGGLTSRIGQGAGIQHWDGLLPELIVAQPALTAAERQKVEGYLAHKYGTAALLPGNHPYKTNKPLSSYIVTIAEIAEHATKPADSARWAESRVELVLLEV